MNIKICYTMSYDIGFLGVEKLHPFDSRKYSRAWRILRDHFGAQLSGMRLAPRRPASRRELMSVHTPEYLRQLRSSQYIAKALELPAVRRVPAVALDWCVLRPMRWGVSGTIHATSESMDHGVVINLSGGYHHAKPGQGEGFSIYADAAIAIKLLRGGGRLARDASVAYVDLDAHQGNGFCHAFVDDSSVSIFDMYNSSIYPNYDEAAQRRIDWPIPLTSGCCDDEYLLKLTRQLPEFLDSFSGPGGFSLAIYNAGTDILESDPLGMLSISGNGILERDWFVLQQLRARRIPTVMVLSGGYTDESHRLIAQSIIKLADE